VAPDLHPTELLAPLLTQEAVVTSDLHHLEMHTMEGLLGILWHGPFDSERAVLLCPGGMGGFLGPASCLYPWLGQALSGRGIATLRVGYRRPSRLEPCVLDVCAAADLAAQRGATRFVAVGHSFGGAVALNCALALPGHVAGVVALATQSAGCEGAARYGQRPLLLVHGTADEILDATCSQLVRQLAGTGHVVLVPDDGHLLDGAAGWLRAQLPDWIEAVLSGEPPALGPLG